MAEEKVVVGLWPGSFVSKQGGARQRFCVHCSCGILKTALNNCYARARRIGQAEGGDYQCRVAGFRAERHKQHLVLVAVDFLAQGGLGLLQTQLVQRALENLVLQARAESLQQARDASQPLGIGDVVADEIAAARGGHGGQSTVPAGRVVFIGS